MENASIKILKNLKENLKKGIIDVRQQGKIEYKIWDSIVANIYDWDGIHDVVVAGYDWFRAFLQMAGRVSSVQTYERIFSLIDYKGL